MIRGRQPHILPLATDPVMAQAAVYHLDRDDDGQRRSYDGGENWYSAYLAEGPMEPPVRQPDGSGLLRVELDDATVEVEIPSGTTWVELTTQWSADDEDDLACDIGPADPLGGIVAEQLVAGDELTRALSGDVREEVDDWLAAHGVALAFEQVQVTADPEGERAVRRESALRDLVVRLLRHVDAPGVAGRVAQARAGVGALGEHPLRQVFETLCDDLDRMRPRAEHDLETAERRAWRQNRKRTRRHHAELARRNVVRFIGEGWDDEHAITHWRLFETEVPEVIRWRLITEIISHVNRIAVMPPKRSRASSPAPG